MHPLLADFERQCAAADTKPTTVLLAAGFHRSVWARWKGGTVSPTLRSIDKVNAALGEMRERTAA